MGLCDVVSKTTSLKWRWGDHLARYADQRWTKRVIFGEPKKTSGITVDHERMASK